MYISVIFEYSYRPQQDLIVRPVKHFSRNPEIRKLLFAMAVIIICTPGDAATEFTEHEFYLLQHYKLVYPEEIFDFCVQDYGLKGSRLRSCLIRNDKLKQSILNVAQDQLGRRSLAQKIYDECLDYHPNQGVGRIVKCVETRLILASRLKDDTIEEKIYERCDFKWRKHGALAIDNCARTESNYYRDKGVLRE